MIFRYDNAPHHQDIETLPHHKHLSDKIVNSSELNTEEVLAEIKMLIVS